MRKYIIDKSPFLYSFGCFVFNSILIIGVFSGFIIFTNPLTFSLAISSIVVLACWLWFWSSRNIAKWMYDIFFDNSATACAEVFIYYHRDQKTNNLVKGFKLIAKFRNWTSLYWLFYLLSKKNEDVRRVVNAFKKFVNLNEKVFVFKDFRTDEYKDGMTCSHNYILVEI